MARTSRRGHSAGTHVERKRPKLGWFGPLAERQGRRGGNGRLARGGKLSSGEVKRICGHERNRAREIEEERKGIRSVNFNLKILKKISHIILRT